MNEQKDNKMPKTFKIILVGETGVGKTSIFNRFCTGKYEGNHSATVGVDFEVKDVKYNDKDYSIQIFDTAGQERFRSIITSYFRLADAFFVVFDLTNKNSLEYVPDCIETLKETIENPKFIILGNKDDLKRDKLNDNEIFKVLNTIDNFDSNYFFKVSAKEGKSIYRVFNVMIDFLKGGIIEKDIQSFKLNKTGKKKKIEKNMKCC